MTPSIRLNPRQHGVNLWWNRDGIDPRQPMSALGHKQTFRSEIAMSALPPKADMCDAISDVR
jgi:hypothetical protein